LRRYGSPTISGALTPDLTLALPTLIVMANSSNKDKIVTNAIQLDI
jgi:hypothetical protein